MGKYLKRIAVIPDGQNKPGAPQDHWTWVGKYLSEKHFDIIVNIGDWWDFASLSRHETPGSLPMEGKRYKDDLYAGDHAFGLVDDQIVAEIERLKRRGPGRPRNDEEKPWNPRKVFCKGNHDIRPDRIASQDAKLIGTIGSFQCNTRDWEVHEFLERVFIDDILFTHYLQNNNNPRPIGGGIENRLTKVGCSFVVGHVQGLTFGSKQLASGKTIRGVEAGSCYLHREEYRGAQGQDHFRGLVVLNEVRPDGRFGFMDISLDYLCRRYEGMPLHEYMTKTYKNGDWSYLT